RVATKNAGFHECSNHIAGSGPTQILLRKLRRKPPAAPYKYLSTERVGLLENRKIRFTQLMLLNDPLDSFMFQAALMAAVLMITQKEVAHDLPESMSWYLNPESPSFFLAFYFLRSFGFRPPSVCRLTC